MQSTRRRLVVDVALQGHALSVTEQADRAKVLQRLRVGDAAFRQITRAAAITVLVILGGIIVSLVHGAWPALREFGFSFLYVESWNPVTEKFGALAPIYGTVVTSIVAMLIAVPVGLFIALFLTELCPMWLRRPIGIAIELLAGIPSIIYGIWGLFVSRRIHHSDGRGKVAERTGYDLFRAHRSSIGRARAECLDLVAHVNVRDG